MHIKICGLTNFEDAVAAVAAGADYLGFNFYPRSPRCVTPAACAEMVAALRARRAPAITVGIFVNQPPGEMAATLQAAGLDLAQLHGNEQLDDMEALRGRAFVAVRDPRWVDFDALAAFGPGRPAFLLDANAPNAYGGTGQTADWEAAQPLAARYPIFLAGGLTPSNVAAAIRQVRPWGVDVASGVEAAPGRKDVEKMRAFVAAARAVQSAGDSDGQARPAVPVTH
jgi:phosphoribosylanthranilate isomerase